MMVRENCEGIELVFQYALELCHNVSYESGEILHFVSE
jgi:hypothetical protein